tara:strand:- start:498 stop:719 length:222 start_codon:yes stop_codon:yes gene_type:complete
MDEDLLKQKDELIELKYFYLNEINEIEAKIKNIQNKIYENCIIKNNGHKWIREREEGPYGETFFYCKYCDCGK